jgi:transposase
MPSIAITSSERKDLIREMKRERQPSRRLRMHIGLLASDGLSPTEIARVLFCSRTTVYALAARFVREKQAAFFDRRRRGPKPSLEESRRTSASSVWWKRGHPPLMAGYARAGAASS